MKLSTSCPSCQKGIKIKSWAATRPELEMEKGDEFNVNCNHCGITTKKHVNEIVAEKNLLIIAVGVLLGIVTTYFLWDFGFISTFSGAIPLLFWQQEERATNTFNSYTIKRK